MVDYEEQYDVLIESELEDSNFIEEHDALVACVIRKCSAARRFPTPRRDIKFSIQGVRSRIKSALLSLTMKTERISSLEHLWIT